MPEGPRGAFAGLEGTRPYEGSAWYYAESRGRLSEAFVRLVVHHLGWTASDRVMDLGAGPTQIARRFAPHVSEVVAIDPEPDMLAEGEQRAVAEGLTNVRCIVGAAEDLGALPEPPGSFVAVTIGSAFHWMRNQDAVLRHLDGLTDGERGAVLIVGYEVAATSSGVTGRDDSPWIEREPWRVVGEILRRYLAGAPEGPHPRGRHDPFPDIFARSAFANLELLRYDYDRVEEPSVDAALAYHYSLSHKLSRLGDRRAAFETEVRAALADAPTEPVTVRVTDSALIARR